MAKSAHQWLSDLMREVRIQAHIAAGKRATNDVERRQRFEDALGEIRARSPQFCTRMEQERIDSLPTEVRARFRGNDHA